jgi:hypothetical protein
VKKFWKTETFRFIISAASLVPVFIAAVDCLNAGLYAAWIAMLLLFVAHLCVVAEFIVPIIADALTDRI